MADWESKNYKVVTTTDGSPSLVNLTHGESMHHSAGAFSETELIYERPLRQMYQQYLKQPWSDTFYVFSLGLGLGYNEFVVAKLLRDYPEKSIQCLTYESDEFLWQEFNAYLDQNLGQDHSLMKTESSETMKTFSQVESYFLKDSDQRGSLAVILKKLHQKKDWQQKGSLSLESLILFPSNYIFFDAFSKKTSPELWSEEFLSYFLQKATQEKCVISSYACNASFKKSLAQAGFELLIKEGYAGKRNRTVAVRGVSSAEFAGL